MSKHPEARQAKFRQAAFVYLHYAILYEAGVWALHGAGRVPSFRGPVELWLVVGALVAAFVFWGLWWWQNAWLARVVWVVAAARLPALIERAFISPPAGGERGLAGGIPDAVAGGVSPGLYIAARVVVVITLWMLARAGWDL